jgi:DNA-binding NarL/FixJ family response regulator
VRVLVVDDSDVYRYALCSVVAETPGFEVVADASSGREALALIGSLAVQLVLLDVCMPELDGIETARWIRCEYPDVAVLLLTAGRRSGEDDSPLTIEDKRDLSPRWLAEFWKRHGRQSVK